MLPRSSSVAGSGTAAGGSWLETTKNCSRAPLSLEKFTVKITFADPANPPRSTVLSRASEKPLPELVRSVGPVYWNASLPPTLTVKLFRPYGACP